MHEEVARRFARIKPAVDFCALRVVELDEEYITVRQGLVQPATRTRDAGVMITVIQGDGIGYAATGDLTASGLQAAAERAQRWAELARGRTVFDFGRIAYPHPRGEYASTVLRPWASVSMGDKLELLRRASARLKVEPRIVDWEAALWHTAADVLYLTGDGGQVHQRCTTIVPMLSAVANEGTQTQVRTLGGRGYCRQGGLEVLDEIGYEDHAAAIGQEALQLLLAPDCPAGQMDLLVDPDQMVLQIHESIGHPLELDRILGDERNYAGTSFVTPEMFGHYRYGSQLLNVIFDPAVPGEFASYGFDDEGLPAQRAHVIKDGILLRGLGGLTSQARSGIAGVACTRGSGWARPPIDRITNLNLEPGDATLEQMVGQVERGLYVKTNCSWSIDDSRNKFQFGCEWGRLIEEGRLTTVVKNSNYRGISATFWRSLARVGAPETVSVLGSPYCGKGEPNQVIGVGHASPTCLFTNVDVFGGGAES